VSSQHPNATGTPLPQTGLQKSPAREAAVHHLARLVLVAFLFTFIAARLLVFLIMIRLLPDLFLRVSGTHVHHLNYGIFLLSGVGAYLLFRRPDGGSLAIPAVLYGVGLGLTFDEFGMWLHLGGSYWQRASFDAVVVIAAILGLLAAAPALSRFRPGHWTTTILLLLAIAAFAVGLKKSFDRAGRIVGPHLRHLESAGPR